MIEHLAAMLVSAIAFLGAILLYGAFSPRRLGGWKFWICFAAYCVLMEGAGPLANGLYSVYGIIGSGVGRQMLYNTTIYCLLSLPQYKAEVTTMLKDMDFGVYGKGVDGYIHYSLAMDRIQEEEESRKALMDEFDNDEDNSDSDDLDSDDFGSDDFGSDDF